VHRLIFTGRENSDRTSYKKWRQFFNSKNSATWRLGREITFTTSCSIRRSQSIYTIYTCFCSMINYPSGYDHCVVARAVFAEQIPFNTVARRWSHESAWIHSATICTWADICQQQFVATPWSHGYTSEAGWINPMAANGEIKTMRFGEFARHRYYY